MPVDRHELRRRLVTGWKPKQHVQIEVRVLGYLLDEMDAFEQRLLELIVSTPIRPRR